MAADVGTYHERDQVLTVAGSAENPASIAALIHAMDAHLRAEIPEGYKDVQVNTQVSKNWMTVSFLNNSLGEEYWRFSIQFHRAPDETGPQAASRLRIVYTEDIEPDDKFDKVIRDLSAAMNTAASRL